MEKKKLLFVVESFGGGVFTYLTELTAMLCESCRIYLAHSVREQTPENYAGYFDPRVELIRLEHLKRSVNPVGILRAQRELRSLAREIKPDIIHLHSSMAGGVGRLAFRKSGIPLFYTPHGYNFSNPDGGFVSKLHKAAEKALAKIDCTIISCGTREYEISRSMTDRAVQINNGVNVSSLDALRREAGVEDEAAVYTMGRICTPKNPALFNEIALKMPDTRFIWIGDGELRELLTAPNIEITGWLKREDALKIAASSGIFMICSLWEGLSLTLLESMCMGKLCVVSSAPGNAAVIHNGQNGFVCKTAEDYITALGQARTPEAQAMREAARADAAENYSAEAMASRYLAVYGAEPVPVKDVV